MSRHSTGTSLITGQVTVDRADPHLITRRDAFGYQILGLADVRPQLILHCNAHSKQIVDYNWLNSAPDLAGAGQSTARSVHTLPHSCSIHKIDLKLVISFDPSRSSNPCSGFYTGIA